MASITRPKIKYYQPTVGIDDSHLIAKAAIVRAHYNLEFVCIVCKTDKAASVMYDIVCNEYDVMKFANTDVNDTNQITIVDFSSLDKFGRLSQVEIENIERKSYNHGCVLIMTHSRLLSISLWKNSRNWAVYIQSDMDVISDMSIAEGADFSYLRYSSCIAHDPVTSNFVELQLDVLAARNLCKELINDVQYEKLLLHLPTAYYNWHVYANSSQYALAISKDQDYKGKVDIVGVLSPAILTKFKDVTISDTAITNTLMFKIWMLLGIEFELDYDFEQFFQLPINAANLTIKSYTKIDYNAVYKSIKDEFNITPQDYLLEICAYEFAGQHALVIYNSSNSLVSTHRNIRYKPLFGFNLHSTYNYVGVVAANYTNLTAITLLTELYNLTSEDYRIDTQYLQVLRSIQYELNYSSNSVLVVPSVYLGNFLSEIYRGSTHVELDLLPTNYASKRLSSIDLKSTNIEELELIVEALHQLNQE